VGDADARERLVRQLATLAFTDTAQNAVLIGGPGTGKTHLATAIAVNGIASNGKRVRFYSTVDLVNILEQEKREGKAGRTALSSMRMDLVVLDELGHLPFSQAGGALPGLRLSGVDRITRAGTRPYHGILIAGIESNRTACSTFQQ
jgi:DNA replication protein DnaC